MKRKTELDHFNEWRKKTVCPCATASEDIQAYMWHAWQAAANRVAKRQAKREVEKR